METPVNVIIQPADPSEFTSIADLLATANLPTADLPAGLPHFFRAEVDSALAGTVGLELYNPYALLRSLAVLPAYRKHKIGQRLFEEILHYARSLGVTEIFLLTTTAESYFETKGFSKADRLAVPKTIRQTQQFQGVCPNSATVMNYVL